MIYWIFEVGYLSFIQRQRRRPYNGLYKQIDDQNYGVLDLNRGTKTSLVLETKSKKIVWFMKFGEEKQRFASNSSQLEFEGVEGSPECSTLG